MFILKYFGCVGVILLALLFVADAQLPRPEIWVDPPLHANIRIKSNVKGPDAVVFSGPTIDYGVRPALDVADLSAKATDPTTHALAQAKQDEMPKMAAGTITAAAAQRVRKRHAKRAPKMPNEQHQVERWSHPRFQVVSGFGD